MWLEATSLQQEMSRNLIADSFLGFHAHLLKLKSTGSDFWMTWKKIARNVIAHNMIYRCVLVCLVAFIENNASSPPIILHNATCEIATDYTKKKNVLRLHVHDGSEFLFMAQNQNSMVEWLSKIQFYAGKSQVDLSALDTPCKLEIYNYYAGSRSRTLVDLYWMLMLCHY